MLFGETVAVYCENHTEHTNALCGHFSSYITGSTLCLRYEAQTDNAVWGNSRCTVRTIRKITDTLCVQNAEF
jgi:hypothetical protein